MSWDNFDVESKEGKTKSANEKPVLKIHMPNAPEGKMTVVGTDQIKRVYEDAIGARLLIIVDEMAELMQPSGVKTEQGKQLDALKQEIGMIIQSLTQLGRSGGVHMVLATQRNDVTFIPGVVQNNSLALDTKVLVRRPQK